MSIKGRIMSVCVPTKAAVNCSVCKKYLACCHRCKRCGNRDALCIRDEACDEACNTYRQGRSFVCKECKIENFKRLSDKLSNLPTLAEQRLSNQESKVVCIRFFLCTKLYTLNLNCSLINFYSLCKNIVSDVLGLDPVSTRLDAFLENFQIYIAVEGSNAPVMLNCEKLLRYFLMMENRAYTEFFIEPINETFSIPNLM